MFYIACVVQCYYVYSDTNSILYTELETLIIIERQLSIQWNCVWANNYRMHFLHCSKPVMGIRLEEFPGLNKTAIWDGLVPYSGWKF